MVLDIGVLGYRFMGTAHANALARLPMFFPECPPVNRDVVVGRDEDALERARVRLGFDRTATDWQAVVDDVDVFYNLGPNFLHAEPSIAALEAGIPVFCEKPLATSVAEAEAMVEAARSSGVPHAVGFNYRFVPAIQYARTLVDEGALGTIHTFRGRYLQDWLADPAEPWSWRNDAELAGLGALGDIGSHTIDLARFLVGGAPGAGAIELVSGHLETAIEERPVDGGEQMRPVTVDDRYTAQLSFEDGATGLLEASQIAPGHKNDHTVEIHGSEGSLRFSLERLNELEVIRGDDRGYQTILVTDPDDPYVDHWWPPGHVLGWEHTFVHEDATFLQSVANDEKYDPSFEAGLAVQRIAAAIARSDERGSWETVPGTTDD